MTNVTLSAVTPSPQPAGAVLTFAAAASGGVGPYQYKFWEQSGGVSYLWQDWSTRTSFSILHSNPTSFTTVVWARSAGVTTDAPQAQASLYFLVTPPSNAGPMQNLDLSTDIGSPRPLGSTIRISAYGYGGDTPHQFKFFVNGAVGRDWGSGTWLWTATSAGFHSFTVWGRAAGATADSPQASGSFSFLISPAAQGGPVTSVHMNTVLQSPQPAGTTITITASGSGGAAPRQYKWLVKQTPADYQPAKDWSTSTTFDWRPTTAGNYRITLWGRSAGVTSDAAEAAEEIYFAISQPK